MIVSYKRGIHAEDEARTPLYGLLESKTMLHAAQCSYGELEVFHCYTKL